MGTANTNNITQCAQSTYVTHAVITFDVQNYINAIADALHEHMSGKGGSDAGCASLTGRRGMLPVMAPPGSEAASRC